MASDEQQAREAIVQVGLWLASLSDDYPIEGLMYDSPKATLAREFAEALLEKAEVDTIGGCPLCQG